MKLYPAGREPQAIPGRFTFAGRVVKFAKIMSSDSERRKYRPAVYFTTGFQGELRILVVVFGFAGVVLRGVSEQPLLDLGYLLLKVLVDVPGSAHRNGL